MNINTDNTNRESIEQNSVEKALGKLFIAEQNTTAFEATLGTKLMDEAEKINSKLGLPEKKPVPHFSPLRLFAVYFAVLALIIVVTAGGGYYYYMFVLKGNTNNQQTGVSLLHNDTDDNGDNDRVTPNSLKINESIASGIVDDSVTFDKFFEINDSLSACSGVCEPDTLYEVINRKLGDTYSYQLKLQRKDISTVNSEYYYYFVNRNFNVNKISLKENFDLTEENVNNSNSFDFMSNSENEVTEISQIVNDANSKFGSNTVKTVDENEDLGGKTLNISYNLNSNEIAKIVIDTNSDLFPLKLSECVFDSNHKQISISTYEYTNFNVANSTVSTSQSTPIIATNASNLLTQIHEETGFKTYGLIKDGIYSKQFGTDSLTYLQWGNVFKTQDIDYASNIDDLGGFVIPGFPKFNADLKTNSSIGYYNWILYNGIRKLRQYDFSTNTWSEFVNKEFSEGLQEGYAIDFSPKYALFKYSTGDYSVTDFRTDSSALYGLTVYTIKSVNASKTETVELQLTVDNSGFVVRQLLKHTTPDGNIEEQLNYFPVKNSESLGNMIN